MQRHRIHRACRKGIVNLVGGQDHPVGRRIRVQTLAAQDNGKEQPVCHVRIQHGDPAAHQVLDLGNPEPPAHQQAECPRLQPHDQPGGQVRIRLIGLKP